MTNYQSDEQHTVTVVTIDGVRSIAGRARLNEDGASLDNLRAQVANAVGVSRSNVDEITAAFDDAFEQVEAIPGDNVVVEMAYAAGTVIVERRIAA